MRETDSDGVSWNPLLPGVGDDQHAAHDELRERCPVAHSGVLGWSLFRHADIVQVVEDDENFSAVVSSHLSVPNGMDPPEHERYRRAIEPYFNEESMSAFHPKCTALARDLVAGLPMEMEFDFCERFGRPYAARVQCAFMGWPEESGLVLSDWLRRSQSATASRSKEKQELLAVEFEQHVLDLLERRRRSGSVGDDVTGRLLGQQEGGLTFSYDELVSVLRNWTAGELGTIAASVGILVHTLAENALLQEQLREDRLRLGDGVLEILRAHGPLVSNRRIVKRACRIGQKNFGVGDKLSMIWSSGNRDDRAFPAARECRLERSQEENLLYGRGRHVCPGKPLAQMELTCFLGALFDRSSWFRLANGAVPLRAKYPASGFSTLPVVLESG